MTEETIHVTEEGYRMYQEKLEYLRTVVRAQIAERIRQAKEFGDISENAEYETAKSDQAFVEGEIIQLENLLRRARVIDKSEIQTSEVGLGSTVEVKDAGSNEKWELTLVGSNEADPVHGKLSNESPLGAAILGRKKGDTVEVKAPGGLIKYKIVSIKKL
ncbi:MAG: transcription elongation factor GreA [Candidatus Eremiobacterota bacterium]